MSPKSGSAGQLVKPTPPHAVKEADTADPGDPIKFDKEGKPKDAFKRDADSPPAHHSEAEENKDKTSWIEIELVYESSGKPVAGMSYVVTLPDGQTVASGSLDDQGFARVDHIDPGACEISFPDLDKEAWEDA